MKLYEVPRNTRILVEGHELDFKHIDGMYSLCYDDEGNPVHLAVWTDVEIVDKEKANDQSTHA